MPGAYGKVLAKLQDSCILDGYCHYPGLTFTELVNARYAKPRRSQLWSAQPTI